MVLLKKKRSREGNEKCKKSDWRGSMKGNLGKIDQYEKCESEKEICICTYIMRVMYKIFNKKQRKKRRQVNHTIIDRYTFISFLSISSWNLWFYVGWSISPQSGTISLSTGPIVHCCLNRWYSTNCILNSVFKLLYWNPGVFTSSELFMIQYYWQHLTIHISWIKENE
jgi:hypothetical protein